MVVTVIMPTYNRSQYIEEAICSVARQTCSSLELIVVDDGSKDDTRAKVAAISDRIDIPLHYIYQENRGAAAARNAGIEAAGSELLCFLDSDDRFKPDKIAMQAKALRESGCLISHTKEVWYRRGFLLNQKKIHQPREGDIFRQSLRMCVVGMSTVMVYKKIFASYGMFDESLPCCEDYDFWLRVSAREKFNLVQASLTDKHGGREDQLSVIHRMGMDRYRIKAIVNLLENVSLTENQYKLAAAELARKCRIYGNGCIKHGKIAEGCLYLDLSRRYHGGDK